MGRSARILLNNVSYHIITRGSRRENIFLERSDYLRYLNIIRKYKLKFNINIYAFCLMTNHVHLLAHPYQPENLEHFMHRVNLTYAMYYNYKYRQTGHLWQNRYKSFIVQNDSYLINVVSYIEYNPLRAKMCQRAEDYEWSSYKYRIFGEDNNILDDFEW